MALEFVSRLLSMAKARGRPHVLAVAAAGEPVCLESVQVARDEGLLEPLLYGDRPEIEGILRSLGADPGSFRIEHVPDPVDSAHRACQAIVEGRAGLIMKGQMQTGDLLRVYFDRRYGLRGDRPLSHVGLFEVPGYGRLFALTDAAINVAPDDDRMLAIARNAVGFMQRLGWRRPKLAIVAAIGRVTESQPFTASAARVAERIAREIPDCDVAGPLALDEAMSPGAAATKGVGGAVAGNADVVMVSSIEAGNVIYKSLTMFAHAKVVGACVGGRAPIVMTSRADTEETKLLSMALSCILSDDHG